MNLELAFTPSGQLSAVESAAEPSRGAHFQSSDGRLKRIEKAFAMSQGEGLFTLATERPAFPISPSLAYWQEFAGADLTELCHTPEQPAACCRNRFLLRQMRN